MATNKPPTLVRHDQQYWYTDQPETEVLAWFRSQPNIWHEWDTARNDLRRAREFSRFYHRPGVIRLPGAGVVLEHRRAGGVWLRTVGTDAGRAAAILRSLEAPAEPEPEQLALLAEVTP